MSTDALSSVPGIDARCGRKFVCGLESYVSGRPMGFAPDVGEEFGTTRFETRKKNHDTSEIIDAKVLVLVLNTVYIGDDLLFTIFPFGFYNYINKDPKIEDLKCSATVWT